MLFLLSTILHLSGLSFIQTGSCLLLDKDICPNPRINIYLYTDENKEEGQNVAAPYQDTILKSNFKPEKNNKIIIHGFYGDIYQTVRELKDAYLVKGNCNVWMVDWEKLAAGLYPVVISSLDHVGACVAKFIQALQNVTSTSFQNSLHIIGFSLGAHVATYIAKYLKPYRLPRITGLDPALSFSPKKSNRKLSKKDAEFVDVVHTDVLFGGRTTRSGHVDFYVNGGLSQPGCILQSVPVLSALNSMCNHSRSVSYFAESITSKVGFWGWPCASFFQYMIGRCPLQTPTVLMGEYCDPNTKGFYIVMTGPERPFAIGKNLLSN